MKLSILTLAVAGLTSFSAHAGYCACGENPPCISPPPCWDTSVSAVAPRVVTGSGEGLDYSKTTCDDKAMTELAEDLAIVNAESACGAPNDPSHIQQISAFSTTNLNMYNGPAYGFTCRIDATARFECR